MTSKIIKLKESDVVPENAKFLYASTEKEVYDKIIEPGIFFDTIKTRYVNITYFYYEVNVD